MLSRRRTRLSAWQSLTDRYCVLRTRLCRGRAAGLRSRLARTPLWRHYGSAEPCGTSRLQSRTPGHVLGVHLRRLFPMIMLYVGLKKAPRVKKRTSLEKFSVSEIRANARLTPGRPRLSSPRRKSTRYGGPNGILTGPCAVRVPVKRPRPSEARPRAAGRGTPVRAVRLASRAGA